MEATQSVNSMDANTTSSANDVGKSDDNSSTLPTTKAATDNHFLSLDIKKRLSALKALQPILEAVIAKPGTASSDALKKKIVSELLTTSGKHLPAMAELVSAEGPWATAMTANILNGMVCDAWKNRNSSDISDSIALLTAVAGMREFKSFSVEIGALDWNHRINDPLDGISAMRLTAMDASQRFIDNVREFDFFQEDHAELIARLLKLTHKLAFSSEDDVRSIAPSAAIGYRQSLLNRASAIVSAEYERIARFNKGRLDDLASTNVAKFDAAKNDLKKGGIETVMTVVEKYSQSSYAALIAAADSYAEMLTQYGNDQPNAEKDKNKGA
ncbi:MAG: hypothetical protein Q7K26_01580 [bacterium]|nr:hypothetical protein [bacterium]